MADTTNLDTDHTKPGRKPICGMCAARLGSPKQPVIVYGHGFLDHIGVCLGCRDNMRRYGCD